MFGSSKSRLTELEAILSAIDKSRARVEFSMDGLVLDANRNFLDLMGYTLAEIKGKPHGLFVDQKYVESGAYTEFWNKLRQGAFQAGEFRRFGKGGKEVWIEAAYNPIIGRDGRPYKVVKFAGDLTEEKQRALEMQGKIEALGKSQAVIEFALDGTILDANKNFLDVLGYALDEIKGKHHGMLVEPAYRGSSAYAEFWDRLRHGEFQAAQFKRIGKGGREVWIEASYNPILDSDGKPYKVVKFATDITGQVAKMIDLKKLIDVNIAEIENAIEQSGCDAKDADRAASETSSSVQIIASSSEELAASIREISESMTKSHAATEHAHAQVVAADEATRRLSEAAAAMSGIVSLIQNIAGQINLLALNATIESARAGEAGKGFAVVAGEVKNLANQAARATGQITTEISGIQAVSADVVQALGGIRQSIEHVRNYVGSTASAVEEQSAVTRDMSANMGQASNAVDTISARISTISAAIAEAGVAVNTTKEAAVVLAR